MDNLKIFSRFSKLLQYKRSNIAIGKEEMRKALILDLSNLKFKDGSSLSLFLEHAQCFDPNDVKWRKCKSEDVDHMKVKYNNIEFSDQVYDFPMLKNFRVSLGDYLIEEIERYYPSGTLEAFEVLNPNRMPQRLDEATTYSSQIHSLATLLGFSEDEMEEDFITLLTVLIQHHPNKYNECLQEPSTEFWPCVLQQQIDIPGAFKMLIYRVLVIPMSSADAEKGFSIFNHIWFNRQTRLTTKHIDDMMRIRINGESLKDFNPEEYVIKWIDDGHLRTDDPNQDGSKKRHKSR